MSESDSLIRRRQAVVPPGVASFAGATTAASAQGAFLSGDQRDDLAFAAGYVVAFLQQTGTQSFAQARHARAPMSLRAHHGQRCLEACHFGKIAEENTAGVDS